MRSFYHIRTGKQLEMVRDLGAHIVTKTDKGKIHTYPRAALVEQSSSINAHRDEIGAELKRRERGRSFPDFSHLPLFSKELNASEQLTLFTEA